MSTFLLTGVAEFKYATDGKRAFRLFSKIWGSGLKDERWIAPTTRGTMNPATVVGLRRRSKPTIDGLAQKLPSRGRMWP
jgi:hypothetical protein